MKKKKQIESLTATQEAAMSGWVAKWTAIGLSTERANRATFESAAAECYRAARLAPPKRVVWTTSPLAVALGGPIAAYLLRANVLAKVRANVRDNVSDNVLANVLANVSANVSANVRANVSANVRDKVLANWSRYMGGQFWVGDWWGSPAVVSFFTEVCGLSLPPDISRAAQAYADTCASACWWWPHKDFILVSERPFKILRDASGRLHSLDGKAIEWLDGFGVSAIHGTVVPDEWTANRAGLDPATALTWPNIEQRRAAAEIVGWDRVLSSLSPRVIDEDHDPTIGSLLEVDLPDAPGERFLRVQCGTGRTFVLPVGREHSTALAANAWTFDIDPSEIRSMEVRT
jgi:hypothetical protein